MPFLSAEPCLSASPFWVPPSPRKGSKMVPLAWLRGGGAENIVSDPAPAASMATVVINPVRGRDNVVSVAGQRVSLPGVASAEADDGIVFTRGRLPLWEAAS
ncbi:hypothetical protein I7I51_04800 [Histoplasma capsulatum]|uniref:Uncharacterized protein n=1 Tax=Ajellomyces capsulatus TaxID=5037 RepID=A0A8A1M5T2_AJECA|nr:hypothetical protein I7I51_04800 [Histoplasma capsulatum]